MFFYTIPVKNMIPEAYAQSPFLLAVGWFSVDDDGMLYISKGIEGYALAEGYPCGEETCRFGGLCDGNQCTYNRSQYAAFWCEGKYHEDKEEISYNTNDYENNDKAKDNRSIVEMTDENDNCLCNGTLHLPSHSRYECNALGWHCLDDKGCDCGSVKCKKDSYCIRPGVCYEEMK